MRNFLFLRFTLVNFSYADYFEHPESQEIINELVEIHGFDKKYVETVLKDAKKQQKIIDSISKISGGFLCLYFFAPPSLLAK